MVEPIPSNFLAPQHGLLGDSFRLRDHVQTHPIPSVIIIFSSNTADPLPCGPRLPYNFPHSPTEVYIFFRRGKNSIYCLYLARMGK
jgi:hypothetical protein